MGYMPPGFFFPFVDLRITIVPFPLRFFTAPGAAPGIAPGVLVRIIGYVFIVENLGFGIGSSDTTLTITLPSGITGNQFQGFDVNTAGQIIIKLPNLGPSQSTSTTITIFDLSSITPGTPLTLTAQVTNSQREANPSDNIASVTVLSP